MVKPLKYLTFMKRRRVIQMVFTSWGIPFLLTLAFSLLSVRLNSFEHAMTIVGYFWPRVHRIFIWAPSRRSWKRYISKPCFVDNCASPCSVALFRLRKLSSSYWRYSGPVKVIRVPYNRSSFACPCTETKKLHQVAIDRRGDTSKQTRFFYQGGISWGDWLCWRHSHQDSGTTWKQKRFCQS